MDVGLGRVIQFDERSRAFPISTAVEGKKYRSYTWRCLEWLDQGPDGACVGFMLGHEAIARPAEMKGVEYTTARDLYWEAQKIDPWNGGAYPGADEFYEGTSVLAGIKAAQRRGWFEEYRWAFSLSDLILGVGHNGPAIMGVTWFEDMFTPDSKGFVKPTGPVAGGHAILCRAVNVKKGYFTIRNSWGINWGKKGDFYITFADMKDLLAAQGEAAFAMHRHRKAQPKKEVEE